MDAGNPLLDQFIPDLERDGLAFIRLDGGLRFHLAFLRNAFMAKPTTASQYIGNLASAAVKIQQGVIQVRLTGFQAQFEIETRPYPFRAIKGVTEGDILISCIPASL